MLEPDVESERCRYRPPTCCVGVSEDHCAEVAYLGDQIGLRDPQYPHGVLLVETERVSVQLLPGDTVIGRMPDEPERGHLGLDEGVPVFGIHHSNGKAEVLPADRTKLTVPA